jgi:hypothetical protein
MSVLAAFSSSSRAFRAVTLPGRAATAADVFILNSSVT